MPPDGRSDAEVGFAGDEVVWCDAATRAVRRRFAAPGCRAWHVAFAPDGRTIRAVLAAPGPPDLVTVKAGDGTPFTFDRALPAIRAVATWDLATGREARIPVAARLDHVVDYSSDGRLAANFEVNRSVVQVHDLLADRPVGPPIPVGGDAAALYGMVHIPPPIRFTPDGRTLLVGQPDGRVESWTPGDAGPPRSTQAHPPGSRVQEVAASPDGRTLASTASAARPTIPAWFRAVVARAAPGMLPTAEYGVALTDRATGRTLGRAPGASAPRFAPDGRSVILLEADRSFSIRVVPDQ